MSTGRLHSLALLVLSVSACGGDDVGVSGDSAGFITLLSSPMPPPTPVPMPAPAPAPVSTSQSSLLPFIDNSKIPAPEVGFATARIQNDNPNHAKPSQNNDDMGSFRTACTFSHMNYDDAIVYPGRMGASHLHAYFGNTGANYASTRESIETAGNSTCAGGTANRTGYWVPAVIDTKDGAPVKPDRLMVYYKTSYTVKGTISPLPAGLRMIAGDMKSTGPQERMNWVCYNDTLTVNRSSKTIPADCPVGATLEARIEFPICWDGKNLDSPDHKSHMSYPVQLQSPPFTWICPTSHPVLMPTMTEMVQYTITEAGQTARWRLSSDNYGTDKAGGYSLHADWFNGWDAKVQETWIKNCLNAKVDCHGFLLGDGTTLY